jgi:signal peptidase II
MNLRNHFFWLVAIASLMLDRLTKAWVVQTLPFCENLRVCKTWSLWPGVFDLTYVRNPGAAFSWCSESPCREFLPWVSIGVSLFLIGLAVFNPQFKKLEQIGFGFLLGGALGNGIDRVADGSVIDFLYFRLINFPVFNWADVSVNLGIICLLIAFWQQSPQKKEV